MISIFNNLLDGMSNITNKLFGSNKWKLKIYMFDQYISTIKVDKYDTNIFKTVQIVKVRNKKHLFKTNHTMIAILPTTLLFLNEIAKEIHVSARLYEGKVIEDE